MNIKKELEKSNQDILIGFERKKHLALIDTEKFQDYELLIRYLLVVSEISYQKNQYYFIAVNVIDVYIQFFHNRKSHKSTYEVSLDEERLINILFESCILAKRYDLAKTMLKISDELNVNILDDKGYIKQLNASSLEFKKRIVVRFIYGTLFFISLPFIKLTMTNIIILTLSVVTIEILIAYLANRYSGF